MNTGEWGEQFTADWLEEHGCRILARNYHSRFGEIDIIAAGSRYLVFVEVKTRSSVRYGTPAQAVNYSKQKKLLLTAQRWLYQHPTKLQPRFDVAEVYIPNGRESAEMHYIPSAFEVNV